MKAMILAAGRGERLKPMTDSIPKPLLKAGKKSLIEYHLANLAAAGIKDVVINISWLGEKIKKALGDGKKYQLNIAYSDEGEHALETAGGIINALPLLGDEPFIVVNGDIWTDFDLSTLITIKMQHEAHLVLVKNPTHHDKGDFALKDNYLENTGNPMFTFSGIGLYTPDFFKGKSAEKTPLAPIIREKITQHQVTGTLYSGVWTDVGTAERLQILNDSL